MKQKNLWLMCGIPGSGKSTWIREEKHTFSGNSVTISRDEVRFEMLKDDEDYFAHENEVFDTFCSYIQEAINSDEIDNIFVDATHLNQSSRNKVLNRLDLTNVVINPINFMVPLDVCLKRNAQRTGRAYVPESAIKRMANSFRPARDGEKYEYNYIVDVVWKEDDT